MVKTIFEKALNLTSGQSLDIPIESKEHGLSFRTMFYRERKRFLEQGMHTDLVVGSIKEIDGSWVASIKCQEPLIMTLHKEDGTSEKLPLDFGVAPTPEVEISDDIRELLEKHRGRREANDG